MRYIGLRVYTLTDTKPACISLLISSRLQSISSSPRSLPWQVFPMKSVCTSSQDLLHCRLRICVNDSLDEFYKEELSRKRKLDNKGRGADTLFGNLTEDSRIAPNSIRRGIQHPLRLQGLSGTSVHFLRMNSFSTEFAKDSQVGFRIFMAKWRC